MTKKLFTMTICVMAVIFGAKAQTLVMDVLDGHTDNWTTYNAGPWSYDVQTGEFKQLQTGSNSWTIYGNNGAIHKDNYYWTFYGGEAFTEDDPAGLDTEYGYQQSKITVRKWDDQTWMQVGATTTYPVTSGLAFPDLTYDPNDDEVYAIILSISGANDDAFSGYRFGTLDLETMKVNIISKKDIYTEIRAIAAHPNGKIYAIDYSGHLYTIDKATGDLTEIGYTGHKNQRRMQTMVADWRTGKLYFAGFMNDGKDHSQAGNRYGTAIYEVDPQTANMTELFQFPNKEMVSGLYVVNDIVKKANDLNVKLTYPLQMNVGETTTFVTTVKNVGTAISQGYTVSLMVNDRVVVTAAGEALEAGASHDYSLAYTPTVGDGNEVKVRAIVEYAADENLINNKTNEQTITVVQSFLPTVDMVAVREGNDLMLAWDAPQTEGARTENFERYAAFAISGMGDWTLLDLSGKQATVRMGSWEGDITYPNAGRPFAWQVFNPRKAGFDSWYWAEDTCTYYCQSGEQMLMAAAGAIPASNTSGYEMVQGNEWLISPRLNGKAQTISFYAKTWTSQVRDPYGEYMHYPEQFNVLYSTTDTNPESFTSLTPEPVQAPQWFSEGAFTYQLPEGALYFAIQRVSDGEDGFFLYLDDITYTPAPEKLLGYNLYCNGQKVNSELLTVTDYTITNHPDEDAIYGISAVYERGESALSNTYFFHSTGINGIMGSTRQIEGYYTLSGQYIGRLTPAQRGLYVVRRGNTTSKIMVK